MKRGVLSAAALLCATYLCIALTVLGIDKFHYIVAGGKKFGTFPDFSSQFGIGASYMVLWGLYLLWFFGAPAARSSSFATLLRRTWPFLLIAFIAYPLGNDVYLYLHAGLMNLSGVNPFLTRAGAFTSVLTPFVDWGQTSTYGPISQSLFTISAAAVSVHPVLAIYIYKIFCLGLHIFNGYLVWKLLPEPHQNRMTTAYLLNPLLLMEQVGSGHVDVLVSTSLVIFTISLIRKHYAAAFMALWGGFLAKTIPLIWMPLTAVYLLKQRRWKALAAISALSIGLIAVLWFTALPGLAAWGSLLNPGVSGQYQSSLMTIAKFFLDLVRIFDPLSMTLADERDLLIQLSHYALAGFAAFYGWMLWHTYRQRSDSPARLIENIGWTTMVLLLFATPWLMPWYASVLITIAVLIPEATLFGLTSLAFGVSSSAQYILLEHSSLKSFVAIGLPILVLILSFSRVTRSVQQALPASSLGEQPTVQ